MTALILAAAILTWPPRAHPRRRVRAITASVSTGAPRDRRWLLVTAAAAVAVTAAGGITGVVTASVIVLVLTTLRHRRRHSPPDPDLPLVADLLASCLLAGVPMPRALEAAATASRGSAAGACTAVVQRLLAGDAPDRAWSAWLGDRELGPIARPCVRASDSGAATAAEIHRAASRLRSRRRAHLQARVQRTATWVVLPLGVCFLPAFVLIGVVPVAVGLADHWH